MTFCESKQIHLISDEVYAMSVFDSGNPNAVPFTSVLSFDTTDLIDPNLLHCLYGMSKVRIYLAQSYPIPYNIRILVQQVSVLAASSRAVYSFFGLVQL
jgi:hypothetical protein